MKFQDYYIVFREYCYEPTQYVCGTEEEAVELAQELEKDDEIDSVTAVVKVKVTEVISFRSGSEQK